MSSHTPLSEDRISKLIPSINSRKSTERSEALKEVNFLLQKPDFYLNMCNPKLEKDLKNALRNHRLTTQQDKDLANKALNNLVSRKVRGK